MGFPDHYTQPPHTNITDRSRNTMLGNSWHVPTAIWMLFLLLISAQSASIHPGVQYTNLQKMTTIWNNSAVPWGPPPQTPPHHYMPQMDWTRHLHWAQLHHQNSQQPDPLDPTLHWAIQQQARIPNINEVRANIAMELQSLVSEWADTTDTWFRQLPDHCQRAYRQPKMITQIPLLHHLLQTIQYPHADILFRELTEGFPLIGNLQPGLNWKVRTDTKYTEHQSVPELHTYNRAYILKKLHQHRVDDHWQMMADEIAKEVQMGRMDGLFTAPHGGMFQQSLSHATNIQDNSNHYHIPHQSSPWHSAHTRPAQMVNPRSDVEKTGGGAAITDPATWQTNLIVTLQTIMYGLHSTPETNTQTDYMCGDMTMMALIKTPVWHTYYSSPPRDRPFGYTTSCSLGATPVCGLTIGLVTC